MTVVVGTSSAQHAAVNFGQWDHNKFIPMNPPIMMLPPHKKGEVWFISIYYISSFLGKTKVFEHIVFKTLDLELFIKFKLILENCFKF